MLATLLIFLAFTYLAKLEHDDIHGSVALMATVTLGVGLTGYFVTGIYLFEGLIDRPLLHSIFQVVWLGAGYGAYRLVRHIKEERFSKRYSLENLEE